MLRGESHSLTEDFDVCRRLPLPAACCYCGKILHFQFVDVSSDGQLRGRHPLSSRPDLKMSLEWQESRETLESAASKTEDSSLKLWLESFCPELFPQFQCML